MRHCPFLAERSEGIVVTELVMNVERTELLYANALASERHTESFVLEGDGAMTFPMGRMRLESKRDAEEGQAANIVLWCPKTFPEDIAVSWSFYPIREPGLAILFFAAAGQGGAHVLDPSLQPRSGPYDQYHHGDINAYHVSYFRRMWALERRFQTCNLRKSYGFHLVAQGADPVPAIADCDPPYRMEIVKCGSEIVFSIDGLRIFHYIDDGAHGLPLGGGSVGFRQMAPLIAEYADLTVHRVRKLIG
jgi:hypothetical protein